MLAGPQISVVQFAPTAGGRIRNYSYAIAPCDLPWETCDDQDEAALVQYVGTKGPLAVCVNAHKWQFYKSCVMDGAACGGHDHGSLDHCVQLVGYAGAAEGGGVAASGGGHWIVRNSWVYSDGTTCGREGEG